MSIPSGTLLYFETSFHKLRYRNSKQTDENNTCFVISTPLYLPEIPVSPQRVSVPPKLSESWGLFGGILQKMNGCLATFLKPDLPK
jgi:hypothetical protein